ncbi:hypothetical protein [Demequina sp. NBRC 110055]|uniref:hypothetical protein n=1 Tax=Demequina sp. NBRC 110055 TaxID=1570344 RepID=UPI0009FE7F30|nr:hypothetical protein [Demequina sp. NBRC 110055]
MGHDATDGTLVCDMCGVSLDGDSWLAVAVTRPHATSLGDVGAVFCGQPHAAAWIASPLPDPAPLHAEPRSGRDRAATAGFWAVVAVVATFSLAGVVAVAQWAGLV